MRKKSSSSMLNEENFSKYKEDLPRSRTSLNVWFIGLFVPVLQLRLEFMYVSDALEIQGEAFQSPFTAGNVWAFFSPFLGGFWALLSGTSAVQAGCPSLCCCEREDRDWSGGFSALFQRRNLSGWKGIVKSVFCFCLKTSLWMSSLKSLYK